MDVEQARRRLLAEREEVTTLLADAEDTVEQDEQAEVDSEAGDTGDAAQPLAAEDVDTQVVATLQDRREQIDRALKRIGEGTYGLSVRSGKPIPDERLEADPAAELTVEEAAAEETADRR